MSTESNKIASNTIVQIVGRIVVLVLSLVSIKLITTYLGPSGTGYYNTVITYLSFIIVIADFGLFSVIVREVSKRPEEIKKLFSNVFTLRFVSAIAITALAVIISSFTNYSAEIKTGIWLAALFPVFNLAASVYDMYYQYKLQMHKVVCAEVASKLFVVLLIYYFAKSGMGYYPIIFTISLSAILIFLVKAIISRKNLPLRFDFDTKTVKEIIKMSLPLGVIFVVNNIYFKIDTLLLFYFKGATDVGIYSVSYRVLETTLFAGSYLTSSLKPLLSTSINNDKEKAQKAIGIGATYLAWLGLAITIACVTFPKEIILFLSNYQFLAGYKALTILGITSCLIYVSGLFGEILIAKDWRKAMIILSGSILIVNVTLNLYLIPRYSYTGAALATMISEVILLTATYQVTKHIINIKIDFAKIAKLILIALICIGLGFLIKNTGIYFLFNLVFIFGAYLFMSYYLKAVPNENINNYFYSLKNRWTK